MTRALVIATTLTCVVTLGATGSLKAQGMIAGIALDEESGGAFMMSSPPSGIYRLKFTMFGAFPLEAPYETLSPEVDRETVHNLGFRIASSESGEWGYFVRKFIHSTAFEPGHRDHQPVCDLVLQRFSFKVLKP